MPQQDPLVPHRDSEIVSPYTHQKGRYVPEEGHRLTIVLPGERILAEVKRVVDRDIAIVEILGSPVGRISATLYSKGDVVNVKRDIGDHGIEVWRAITDREIEQRSIQNELERQEEERVALKAREVLAEKRERDLERQRQREAEAEEARINSMPVPDPGNWSA